MVSRIGVFLLLIFLNSPKYLAQVVIWEEDFNSYPDGAIIGIDLNTANPDIDWVTGGCLACADSVDDWWEVRNGILEAKDLNQLGYWQTEVIDIANYQQIQFSLDVVETGDLEGLYFGSDDCVDQTNQDYVDIFYRINGDSWKLVENYLNWCGLYNSCSNHTLYGDDGEASGDCRNTDSDWDSVRVSVDGLTGQTLEIRVELINSSDPEVIGLDNMTVTGDILLPIDLLSFTARWLDRQAILEWQTASERNNRGFIIERNSHHPVEEEYWLPLAEIRGKGDSNVPRDYLFVDEKAKAGKNYYRLKQIDWDSNFSYSPIIVLSIPSEFKIYPNPAIDLVYLSPALSESCTCVEWFDQKGQRLMVDINGINDRTYFSVAHLAAGWYRVMINCQGQWESISMLIQR